MIAFVRSALAVTALLLADALPAEDAPELDSFTWLAGCWSMPTRNGAIEEFWLAPAGGAMLGIGRTLENGKMKAYEYVAIREVDGRIAFVAQPSGQREATFPLVRWHTDELVFENPQHDFPQRVIYRRTSEGIAARIEGMRDGKPRAVDFAYRACAARRE